MLHTWSLNVIRLDPEFWPLHGQRVQALQHRIASQLHQGGTGRHKGHLQVSNSLSSSQGHSSVETVASDVPMFTDVGVDSNQYINQQLIGSTIHPVFPLRYI